MSEASDRGTMNPPLPPSQPFTSQSPWSTNIPLLGTLTVEFYLTDRGINVRRHKPTHDTILSMLKTDIDLVGTALRVDPQTKGMQKVTTAVWVAIRGDEEPIVVYEHQSIVQERHLEDTVTAMSAWVNTKQFEIRRGLGWEK